MNRCYVLVIALVFGIVVIFVFISSQVNYQSIRNGITEYLQKFKCSEETADWSKINVNTMTPKQIVDYFYWTNRQSCRLVHDYGGKMMANPSGFDGQKSICLDSLVLPKSGDCIVYSFGINNEWSFDEMMEKYGCQVYAFDPSMGKEDHKHSDKVYFYNLGLSETNHTSNKGWKMRTLDSIYKMLTKAAHHQEKTIDYLKIDIESAEWKVIPQIIKSGMLKKVRQLGIEFHLGTGNFIVG